MNMANNQPGYVARRAAAFALDCALVWLLLVLQSEVLGLPNLVAVNAAAWLGYRGVIGAIAPASTVGRAAAGLRLVKAETDAQRAGVRRTMLRESPVAAVLLAPLMGLPIGFVLLFSGAPLLVALDFAFIVVRKDRRSLRDLLADTAVVLTRPTE